MSRMENFQKPTITDELVAQFEEILNAFNMSRLIMTDKEARDLAASMINDARRVLLQFKMQQSIRR